MASSPPSPADGSPRLISGELLRSLVPMPDAIGASRAAFTAAQRGELSWPPRAALSRHRVLVMPAEHTSGSAIIKVISVQPDGWRHGLPSIGGSVLYVDGGTGRVSALLDATALTALRTGAASGLATDLLAPPEASVLAMLGTGGQAADQVAAVCAVRPISEVRVSGRDGQRREELCAELTASHPGVVFRSVASPAAAVRGAGVICTATRSQRPLFEATDLEPQVHINAVGAYTPQMCEIPAGAFARASLVVIDDLAAVLAEAGDVLAAMEDGQVRREDLVEIGSLLERDGLRPPGGLTIFKSVGIAAQDWALGELVVRRAGAHTALAGDGERA